MITATRLVGSWADWVVPKAVEMAELTAVARVGPMVAPRVQYTR